jgi:hypothetical protein
MDKELYAAAGFLFALIVSAIIGQFFSGVVVGVLVGYSICDKGVMAQQVWTKLRPHVDTAFARAKVLAGVK